MKIDNFYQKPFFYALLASLLLIMSGCTDQREDINSAAQDNYPDTATNISRLPSANAGIIKEVKNSGSYSYIQVDVKGEKFWLATGISNLTVDQHIAWNDYAVMKSFNSKSLNRVFDQILFVDRVVPVSALANSQHQGTVIETMQSAGYSYIHVKENGVQVWLAAPQIELETGQTISWGSGAPMKNFASESLKRSFDEIFFVSHVNI